MKLKMLVLTGIFVLTFSTLSVAKPSRVSLITISPGNDIFAAFGHTALVFEDSETPDTATLYEYGAPTGDLEVLNLNSDKISEDKKMALILDFFVKLLSGQVKTTGGTHSTTLANGDHFPDRLKAAYLSERRYYREVTMSPLALTDEQIVALKKALDDDLKGPPYFYDNYHRNCATKIRDPLYADAILGSTERDRLKQAEAKRKGTEERLSLQDVAMDSIDEAADLSCRGMGQYCAKAVYLVPLSYFRLPEVRKFLQNFQSMGLKIKYASGREFYDTLNAMDTAMQPIKGFLPPEVSALPDALHSFITDPTISKKPISEYDAAYTPKRLRGILLTSINPATNKPVIDPATEIRKDNQAPPPVQLP